MYESPLSFSRPKRPGAPDPALYHDGDYRSLLRHHEQHVRQAAIDPDVRPVGPCLLPRIADARTMFTAVRDLRAEGPKSPGYSDVRLEELETSEQWSLCRQLARCLRDGTYRPGRDKLVRIPKPGKPGQFRTLTIQRTEDRLVGKAAALVLTPVVERQFYPFSFGFRPKRSPLSGLATALELARREDRWVWVSADVEKAFDRVPFCSVLDACRGGLPEEVVTFLTLIAGTGKKRGVRQGSPTSPMLWNVFGTKFIDRPWVRSHPSLPLIRYADDLLLLCQSREEAEHAYAALLRLARSAGTPLKPGPAIFDLRQGPPLSWLGYRIAVENDAVAIRIHQRAWDELEFGLAEAHLHPAAPFRAEQIVEGWLGSLGPCFEFEDPAAVVRRVREIAGQYAFDELPPDESLVGYFQGAHEAWVKHAAEQCSLLPPRQAQITQPHRHPSPKLKESPNEDSDLRT